MALSIVSLIFIIIGVISALIILFDVLKHPQKEMRVMNVVWPINGLWAGPFCLWAYFTIGKHRKMDMPGMKMDMSNMSDAKPMATPMKDMSGMKMDMSNMSDAKPMATTMKDMSGMKLDMSGMKMDMSNMSDEKPKTQRYGHFWQGVIADTLHCGAGCSFADLIGAWIFMLMPFKLFGNTLFGGWLLDYILALIIGATFQYAAISPMMKEKGGKVWLRALKIDFLSLTCWQIGMYGWMAIATFAIYKHNLSPLSFDFWFMMQIAMCCGFITAYPMNWLLVKKGIKMGM